MKSCHRCQGRMLPDQLGETCCINCGATEAVPVEMVKRYYREQVRVSRRAVLPKPRPDQTGITVL